MGHRSSIRRLAVLAAALALGTSLLAPGAVGAPASPSAPEALAGPSFENDLVGLINQIRAERGLGPLRPSSALVRAAGGHARAMARFGFFGHSSRDGSSPRDRVARIDPTLGAGSVGEVLLWRSPAPSAAQALSMWLGSPPHRAVLLDPGLRLIGLTSVTAFAAPGVFGGLDVTIVAADLAG